MYTKGSTKGNMKSSKKVKKDHIKSNLSKDILLWRKKKHLTQMQLAELLELNRKAVSDWEKGKTIPHETNRLKLGDILGAKVTPDGITENHIDMKIDNSRPEKGNIQVDEDWYKQTINALIRQNGNSVEKLAETADKLHARDQAEISKAWGQVDKLTAYLHPPQNGQ